MSEVPKGRHRRNYRACLNCRLRKVKCDLGSVDDPEPGKCARCKRERKDCVFVESRRKGQSNAKRKRELEFQVIQQRQGVNDPGTNYLPPVSDILSGDYYSNLAQLPAMPGTSAKGDQFNQQSSGESSGGATPSKQLSTSPTNSINETGHFSTMEGALVYLAKAAGTIAKADERDNIDAGKRHQQLEEDMEKPKAPLFKTLLETKLTTVPKHIQDQSNYLSIPISNEFSIRPKGANKLSSIDYIGEKGLLTEFEAEMLINLFFTTMHPYFPHIPNFLHKPQVLAGYPILLCAILTISSRYHSLDDNPNNITTGNVEGVPRNIEIHDKLWLYVQRLISQTVWAEASTRSIGTIFAFLLLTEWNPRAIHWRWTDYANRPEDKTNADGIDGHKTGENLAGLGAMRRSYRMAWMLIGSAVRLAQDMGFMEVSPKTFLATHISEINSVMNISRRSMLSHSLSELEMSDELADDTKNENGYEQDDDFKIQDMTEEEIKEYSNLPIKFTYSQRAQIELLQIMSLSHESLYGYKAQLGSLSQRQNLVVLNIISPLIDNWGKKYKGLMKPSNYRQHNLNFSSLLLEQNSKLARDLSDCIEHEGFIFEYNYAKLYIFSLALSSTKTEDNNERKKKAKVNLKLDEISKSAKYIEQAFIAANEMLAVAHRVHKLKMLRFMPTRWVTRIVRAVAFIVKCYLTITAHKKLQSKEISDSIDNFDSTILSLSLIPVDEIMSSIQKAAITLRDCSPDELHLCTRYSNVLMYLCSEMKSNSKTFENSNNNSFVRPDHLKTFNNSSSSLNSSNSYSNLNSHLTKVVNNETGPSNDNQANQDLNSFEANTEVSTPIQNIIGDSEVMEWFINNRNVGLDFVGPWTEMIEQQLNSNDQFNFDDALM